MRLWLSALLTEILLIMLFFYPRFWFEDIPALFKKKPKKAEKKSRDEL